MRERSAWLVVVAVLAVLAGCCYGRALFRGEQFAYRDAAHFYYPLYQRVQEEWKGGRWPLWEPEENGGMPLLGNPTAAVLYPGKLVFAVTPYPLGARLYVIGHTLLAFATMVALLRSWGVGAVGSGIAGLAYAFGGPVLFQYCNIIYLVGAAWAPLGLRAADRWLRLGRPGALLELAAVLALETLGGDPEVAYLTGVCAGGYAAALARGRARGSEGGPGVNAWVAAVGIALLLAVWVAGTLAVARVVPGFRPPRPTGQPPGALPWMPWVAPAVAAAWGAVGVGFIAHWRRTRSEGERPTFVPRLAGLAAAAVLAGTLAAAQLLPVFEFTGMSARAAGEGPHDIYPFSLEPIRVAELLWPNLFGTPFHGNRSWQAALPPGDKSVKIWVPTLYLGGLTLALALGAATLRARDRAPWRAWMTAVAALSLLGSFGEYTSPLWWARLYPDAVQAIGKHDSNDVSAIRLDGQLRDGDGGLYWSLSTLLPGFRQFRFPSKLLTFTALALAALAGLGWEGLMAGDRRVRRRTVAWAAVLLALSLTGLGIAWASRGSIQSWLEVHATRSPFGPIDAPAAVREMLGAFLQGAVVFAAALALALGGRRRAGLAAVLALAVTGADIAVANARYVLTLPQHAFETTPEIVAVIREAEKNEPGETPFRVHRMPIWDLVSWPEVRSDDRVRDFVAWERNTIQPKYGINYGVQYTLTIGVAELYDYEWFFGGFLRSAQGEVARLLGVPEGKKVVAYSRRAFDLWNTRYFVLPYFANRWSDEHRGYATFLENSERIYPPRDAFRGPDRAEKEMEWVRTHDVQVFRNQNAYPRAWVVHEPRYMKPIRGLNRADRDAPMQEILFSNDFLWRDSGRTVYNPKRLVWVEREDQPALARYLVGGETSARETVKVTGYRSDRVELEANLERPGMVVLADVYYPGWTLTVDGRPAPVFRANRMMRGAALPSGRHKLVYEFRPASFRYGLVASGVGLGVLGLLGIAFAVRPTVVRWTDADRPTTPEEGDLP